MNKLLQYLLILIFGFFLTRVADLMLIRGAYFRRLAEENRIRRIKIEAARGKILDRNKFELARNTVFYLDEKGERIGRQEALNLEAVGVPLQKKWVREYPLAKATAPVTGYLSEASQEEIAGSSCQIGLGELVGRGGVEQFYDCPLRGSKGERLVEVNAKGTVVRQLGQKNAVSGNDIHLTIDKSWQEASWQALAGRKGAIIILNPNNAEVLALVSSPSFNPNSFTKWRDDKKIKQWLNDENFPFLNRAISGAYHPGSVFKIVTATAGLEEGEINAETKIEDTGEIKIGQWRFGNWYWLEYGRKEGLVNIVKAIKRSNDIYFYKTGEWVGVSRLRDWAEKFGFGEVTGIDLPAESGGFLPSPQWKEKAKKEKWFLGNTYHLAIGQGDLTTTPLQIALETAVVANGGRICQPHLRLKTKECHSLGIKKENLELIKQGMVGACSPGGTGFPFFNFEPRVACKTGTAEVGDGTNDSHAWFTLFYPTDEPKIVITVLVERGGSGAYVAAPIAKEIIERYENKNF